MNQKPQTIDEYLAGVEPEKRAALESLRELIHETVPGLEECISYAMPAFKLNGNVVAGFAAGKNQCSIYPFSGGIVPLMEKELAGYVKTKSAVQFKLDRPLPPETVRRMIELRLQELAARGR